MWGGRFGARSLPRISGLCVCWFSPGRFSGPCSSRVYERTIVVDDFFDRFDREVEVERELAFDLNYDLPQGTVRHHRIHTESWTVAS